MGGHIIWPLISTGRGVSKDSQRVTNPYSAEETWKETTTLTIAFNWENDNLEKQIK